MTNVKELRRESSSLSANGEASKEASKISAMESKVVNEEPQVIGDDNDDDDDDDDEDDDDVFRVEVIEPPTHFTSTFRVAPGSNPGPSAFL